MLELLDSRDFLNACHQDQVPLVRCGHTHDSRRFAHHDIEILLCGTTSQFWVGNSKNRLHVVTIDWDGSDATLPVISAEQYASTTTWPPGFQFEKVICVFPT